MIKTISFPIKIVPKPRGNLGKGGHIYHSSKKYNEFNKEFKSAVRNFTLPDDFNIEYICFQIAIKKRRGAPLDGDNCQGAIQDALVKSAVIKDDNYKYISKWYGEINESEVDSVRIYFCESKKEFLYVIKSLTN